MTFRIFDGSMKTTMVGVRILISSLFFHKNAIFFHESVRIRTHHVQILCMCFVYTTNKKVQNCGKTTTSGITNKKLQQQKYFKKKHEIGNKFCRTLLSCLSECNKLHADIKLIFLIFCQKDALFIMVFVCVKFNILCKPASQFLQ